MKIVPLRQLFYMATKRHFYILAFSAIALLGMSVSCKNKNPQPSKGFCTLNPGQCEPTTAAKDYFLFKMGSWWVYEEETTHERDSVYVTEYSDDPASPDFDARMFSVNQNYYYHYFPVISISSECTNSTISSEKCIYIKSSKYFPNDFIGESTCFFIQHYKSAETPVANFEYLDDKLHVIEVYTTYQTAYFTFPKTVQFFEDHNQLEHQSPTNHFYAKGIGLVRKEILDSNQVWNLVDYHIEP